MNLNLLESKVNLKSQVRITGSKSESNRLLLLQALFPEIQIENLSNSDDSKVMQNALKTTDEVIDIHHAGTAMRFLTAYFSIQENREVVLTGSSRMQERPIAVLVDALSQLGAEIAYLNTSGYPPLKISGQKLSGNKVIIDANVSSQYVSALLLIGSKLDSGITVYLEGKITSVPYINMTLNLLNEIGVKTKFEGHTITVYPKLQLDGSKKVVVESDWSSASYFYSIVALSVVGTEISLSAYKENSLQGDAILAKIYQAFGVETIFNDHKITIKKVAEIDPNTLIDLDLSNAPDIAQTIAVTCLGLNVACKLSGLHTLKIKETDRLVALKIEIGKFGTNVEITDQSLKISTISPLNSKVAVDTYNDHRMAMAFAPLALKIDFQINDAEVVSKSFPDFWNDLKSIGFTINE